MNVVLMLVDKPDDETSVMASDAEKPHAFLGGDGDVNLLCGECGFRLCEGLESAAEVQHIVFECPRCKRHSRTRT